MKGLALSGLGFLCLLAAFPLGIVSCAISMVAKSDAGFYGDLALASVGAFIVFNILGFILFGRENADSSPADTDSDWRDDKRAIYDTQGNITGYIDKD